jgi:hypothetical protein
MATKNTKDPVAGKSLEAPIGARKTSAGMQDHFVLFVAKLWSFDFRQLPMPKCVFAMVVR